MVWCQVGGALVGAPRGAAAAWAACRAPTVVVPGVHAVAEVHQAADGVSVAPVGGGVQGGEHVAVRRVHLVLQVLHQHLDEFHPPLQPPQQSRLQIGYRIRAPYMLMIPCPGDCVILLCNSSNQLFSRLLMHRPHSHAGISSPTATSPPAASDGDRNRRECDGISWIWVGTGTKTHLENRMRGWKSPHAAGYLLCGNVYGGAALLALGVAGAPQVCQLAHGGRSIPGRGAVQRRAPILVPRCRIAPLHAPDARPGVAVSPLGACVLLFKLIHGCNRNVMHCVGLLSGLLLAASYSQGSGAHAC